MSRAASFSSPPPGGEAGRGGIESSCNPLSSPLPLTGERNKKERVIGSWPALLATARGALWLSADGEIEKIAAPEAALRAAGSFPLVVHGPATAARLGLDSL